MINRPCIGSGYAGGLCVLVDREGMLIVSPCPWRTDMKRKTAKILCIVTLIGMAVLLGVGGAVMTWDINLVFHCAALYVPIFIWLSSKLRCPHCGSWPRRRRYFDNVCSQCGKDMGE